MNLKFSQYLEVFLKRLESQPLTLKDILEETSEKGFSLIIILLVLPFLVPMPPGLSSVLGFGIFVLSVQMILGKDFPWLPHRLAQFRFPRRIVLPLFKIVKFLTKWLEKIVRPRWLNIAGSRGIRRLSGLFFAWLTILLMLPIPFTNPIPTLGILLLAIANLEEDGFFICVSYGIAILISLFFGFLFYMILQASETLPQLIF